MHTLRDVQPMRGILLCLMVLGACAAARPAPLVVGPKPAKVRAPSVAMFAVRAVLAADTLVSTVRWTAPVDDGKGPLDSLKVNITNLSGGSHSVKFTGAALPVVAVFRQVLPFTDATWTVTAQICTFRGTSANASACVSVTGAPFVYVLAAPPAVTGASVGSIKVP